jgi:hypothetical protein
MPIFTVSNKVIRYTDNDVTTPLLSHHVKPTEFVTNIPSFVVTNKVTRYTKDIGKPMVTTLYPKMKVTTPRTVTTVSPRTRFTVRSTRYLTQVPKTTSMPRCVPCYDFGYAVTKPIESKYIVTKPVVLSSERTTSTKPTFPVTKPTERALSSFEETYSFNKSTTLKVSNDEPFLSNASQPKEEEIDLNSVACFGGEKCINLG